MTAINRKENWKDATIIVCSLLLVTIIMRLFIYLLYDRLIDAYVIDDSFFLLDFKGKMYNYALVGYITATLCFTSYIILAQKVNQLDDTTEGTLKERDQLKFDWLQNSFKNAFFMSALIFCLFVLWTGTLFQSLNSLELLHYYHQVSGKPFFNPDFIYLVGLMHSLLLLIFYVPVQIVFGSIRIVDQQKTEATRGLSRYKKGLVGFFESLASVLITASPLLTSVIQGFITNFLKE